MALEVRIKKHFPGFTLDTSFICGHNRMGILGASGCGKSMTLKCIAGIEKPDEGRITADGRVLFDAEKKINCRPQDRKVGYLFQNYALFPTMTVTENLACVLPGAKRKGDPRVQEQIARFHLEGLENHLPAQLSGGQQQRAALARMLLSEPEIILLDEPFSALDGFLREELLLQMLELLRDFPGEVILVSHNRDEIFKFCDSLTVMDGGRCLTSGATKEIFQNPGSREACRLTGCKNISAVRREGSHSLYAEDWRVHLQTAAAVDDAIRYVAIRGHHIRAAAPEDTVNVMQIRACRCIDAPFEQQYLIKNTAGGSELWWMVSKAANPDLCDIPVIQDVPENQEDPGEGDMYTQKNPGEDSVHTQKNPGEDSVHTQKNHCKDDAYIQKDHGEAGGLSANTQRIFLPPEALMLLRES